jgi:hypothetical protein
MLLSQDFTKVTLTPSENMFPLIDISWDPIVKLPIFSSIFHGQFSSGASEDLTILLASLFGCSHAKDLTLMEVDLEPKNLFKQAQDELDISSIIGQIIFEEQNYL